MCLIRWSGVFRCGFLCGWLICVVCEGLGVHIAVGLFICGMFVLWFFCILCLLRVCVFARLYI